MSRHKANTDSEHKRPKRLLSHLIPTLLYRLQDDHPENTQDSLGEGFVTRKKIRSVLQHDLTLLFNTINHETELNSDAWPELASSVINYGIPPFSGGYASEMPWTTVEKMLRTAITRFEPRLIPETLSIMPLPEEGDNRLHFKIQAFIDMEPYPLEFVLKSSVDLENHDVKLKLVEND